MKENSSNTDPRISQAREEEAERVSKANNFFEHVKNSIPQKIREASEVRKSSSTIWEISHWETNGFGDDYGGEMSELNGVSQEKWESLGLIYRYCLEQGLNPQMVFDYEEKNGYHNYPGDVFPFRVKTTTLKLVISWGQ